MRLIAAALFAVCTLAAQPPASLVKSHFIGVWKLVSCESRSPAGDLAKPYGDKPQGRLAYEADGHVSLQIMRPGNRFRLITRATLPTESNKDDFSEAWFGTWDVDPEAETVVQQVQQSIDSAQVGTEITRRYNFWSNRMILVGIVGGRAWRMVWERESF